jgi:hypothetical protein
MMSAWSAKDSDSFTALFEAAAGDPGARSHVRDLFTYAPEVDRVQGQHLGQPAGHGQDAVQGDHGPSGFDWPDPGVTA